MQDVLDGGWVNRFEDGEEKTEVDVTEGDEMEDGEDDDDDKDDNEGKGMGSRVEAEEVSEAWMW